MKKPLNNFAFALWLIAAVFVPADVWAFWKASLYDPYSGFIPLHTNVIAMIREMVESVLYVSGTLSALGMVIEILDQIRWNAMRRKD